MPLEFCLTLRLMWNVANVPGSMLGGGGPTYSSRSKGLNTYQFESLIRTQAAHGLCINVAGASPMFKTRTSKSTCSVEGATQLVTAALRTGWIARSGPDASKTLREGTRCRTNLMEPTCFR